MANTEKLIKNLFQVPDVQESVNVRKTSPSTATIDTKRATPTSTKKAAVTTPKKSASLEISTATYHSPSRPKIKVRAPSKSPE